MCCEPNELSVKHWKGIAKQLLATW